MIKGQLELVSQKRGHTVEQDFRKVIKNQQRGVCQGQRSRSLEESDPAGKIKSKTSLALEID